MHRKVISIALFITNAKCTKEAFIKIDAKVNMKFKKVLFLGNLHECINR